MEHKLIDVPESMIPQLLQDFETREVAVMLGKSFRLINRWRDRLDMNKPKILDASKYKRPSTKIKPPEYIDDPKIWRNEKWLREAYEVKGYSIPTIAKMVNRSKFFIRRCLKKRGIKLRINRYFSKNPCCNKEWLEEMYIFNEYPVNKCAKLAGVSPRTISDWLVKFGIDARESLNLYGSQVRERNWSRSDSSISEESPNSRLDKKEQINQINTVNIKQ